MRDDPGEVYTTGEAAYIAYVSQQTVIRCFDDGTLRGFRVPKSKFRRIPREGLFEFLIANEIPTDRFEASLKAKRRVLIGTSNGAEASGLSHPEVEIVTTESAFGLSMALAEFLVRAVIIDGTMSDLPALEQLVARCYCRKPRLGEAAEPWFPLAERRFSPALVKWRAVVCIGMKPSEPGHRLYEEVGERLLLLPAKTPLKDGVTRALELIAA